MRDITRTEWDFVKRVQDLHAKGYDMHNLKIAAQRSEDTVLRWLQVVIPEDAICHFTPEERGHILACISFFGTAKTAMALGVPEHVLNELREWFYNTHAKYKVNPWRDETARYRNIAIANGSIDARHWLTERSPETAQLALSPTVEKFYTKVDKSVPFAVHWYASTLDVKAYFRRMRFSSCTFKFKQSDGTWLRRQKIEFCPLAFNIDGGYRQLDGLDIHYRTGKKYNSQPLHQHFISDPLFEQYPRLLGTVYYKGYIYEVEATRMYPDNPKSKWRIVYSRYPVQWNANIPRWTHESFIQNKWLEDMAKKANGEDVTDEINGPPPPPPPPPHIVEEARKRELARMTLGRDPVTA